VKLKLWGRVWLGGETEHHKPSLREGGRAQSEVSNRGRIKQNKPEARMLTCLLLSLNYYRETRESNMIIAACEMRATITHEVSSD